MVVEYHASSPHKLPLATSDSDEAVRLTVFSNRLHMTMITHSVHTRSGVAANHANCVSDCSSRNRVELAIHLDYNKRLICEFRLSEQLGLM